MSRLLTTGEAASLVEVHDSTIKRWCDDEELTCSYTPGGHRRISLEALLETARARNLPCPLLPFSAWAGEVWDALSAWQKSSDPARLTELMYRWLEKQQASLPGRLMELCMRQGLTLPELFDRIVKPVLYRLGDDWQEGRLDVGDEHRMSQVMLDGLYRVRTMTLQNASSLTEPRYAIVGCGEDNQHEMGAQMVRILLEARGWDVIYLGWRVPVEDFALQQQKFEASLVCISLTPPHVAADAYRVSRILGKLYDSDAPFRLAIGGEVARGLSAAHGKPHPFLEQRFFYSTSLFAEWLDAMS